MREAFSNRDRQLLMCLCILAPPVHLYVQGCWLAITERLIPVTQSHLVAVLWLSAMVLVGAALAALLLGTLASRAIRKRPLVLATVIAGATGAATLLMWVAGFAKPSVFTVGEHVAFFLFCWLTADIAVHRLHRHGQAI
jgi:MFS family permease